MGYEEEEVTVKWFSPFRFHVYGCLKSVLFRQNSTNIS